MGCISYINHIITNNYDKHTKVPLLPTPLILDGIFIIHSALFVYSNMLHPKLQARDIPVTTGVFILYRFIFGMWSGDVVFSFVYHIISQILMVNQFVWKVSNFNPIKQSKRRTDYLLSNISQFNWILQYLNNFIGLLILTQ